MDWLSRLLEWMPVTGQLDVRCAFRAPWRIANEQSEPGLLPYHVVLAGNAILEDPAGGPADRLGPGDIVLFPHGGAHVLHDGGGARPTRIVEQAGLNLTIARNTGKGEPLDMLCGHFVLTRPYDRVVRSYMPPRLIVRAAAGPADALDDTTPTGAELSRLIGLLRMEANDDRLGGRAMLNALSAALFTLSLRLASESAQAPAGLLALAGHPRLAPALSAIFQRPQHPWTLPELARLCNMSRATLARHFQDKVGRSASDLLADVRMTLAATALKNPSASIEAVAESVGYQSVSAFKRVFKERVGTTPGEWRRAARGGVTA